LEKSQFGNSTRQLDLRVSNLTLDCHTFAILERPEFKILKRNFKDPDFSQPSGRDVWQNALFRAEFRRTRDRHG
jgi:hypothetical protein